jgi:hypothetical protein
MIKKQNDNPKPQDAALLEKTRRGLEELVSVLVDAKRELTDRRREILETLDSRKPCPICGGKLMKIKNVARKNQHKNRDVWSLSGPIVHMCGDYRYFPDSPICTRCWAAQSFGSAIWTQVSNDPDAFVVPLTPAIAKVPPATKARDAEWTYQRLQMPNGKRHEMISLWWEDAPPEYVALLEKYAREHGLQFEGEPVMPPFRHIRISTPDEVEESGIPGLPVMEASERR